MEMGSETQGSCLKLRVLPYFLDLHLYCPLVKGKKNSEKKDMGKIKFQTVTAP